MLSFIFLPSVIPKILPICYARSKGGLDLLVQKFPDMGDDDDLEGGAVVRVVPKVISVIDYERGFGHTDLLQV